tara:strand:- start:237 stop:413 length:177 start_codon:yes stop_codon:yes gene_type:complete
MSQNTSLLKTMRYLWLANLLVFINSNNKALPPNIIHVPTLSYAGGIFRNSAAKNTLGV